MDPVLGFDFGRRNIGVAVGQSLTGSATPLLCLRRARGAAPDWGRIARLIEDWRPGQMVVGLPLNMDGSDTDLTPEARRFSRQLAARFGLPVALADERLSSREARTRGGPRRNPSDGVYDALAAQVILETWFGEHA